MPATIVDIDRESLWGLMGRGADFVLVDALGPISFAGAHLPGAINLPPHEVDDRAPSRIPTLDTEVVVYCASVDCDSSVAVASRLLELGYRNVKHYPGGKRDWVEGGLPLEGGRVRELLRPPEAAAESIVSSAEERSGCTDGATPTRRRSPSPRRPRRSRR